MANYTSTKTGGVIKWGPEDWAAGHIPNIYFDKTVSSKMLGTKGLAYATCADPYRNFGVMSPGVNTRSITVSGTPKTTAAEAFCEAGGYGWLFFEDDTIHAVNLTNGVSTIAGNFPYTTITGNGGFLSTVVYNNNIYFRYALTGGDAGKSEIGRFEPATGATVDETFMSATAALGAKMDTTSPGMVVGGDEKLYIIDGANVHRYDPSMGANGTLIQDKFQIVGGTIVAYAKVPNYLVLFVAQTDGDADNGECFAYWWDYESPRATYIYPISGYSVIAGFDNFEGLHGCVVRAKSGLVQPANTCAVLTFVGGQYGYSHTLNLPMQPNYNGVDFTNDFLLINLQGKIYQYGQYYPGVKNALQSTAGNYDANSSNGIVRKLTNAGLLAMTWDKINAATIQIMDTGYNSSCNYLTPQFVPPMPFDYRAKLDGIYINWGGVASGGHGINLKLWLNKANSSVQLLTNQTVVTEAGLYQKILYDTAGSSLGQYLFDSLGIEVSYTEGVSASAVPPCIQSIEAHYTLQKI